MSFATNVVLGQVTKNVSSIVTHQVKTGITVDPGDPVKLSPKINGTEPKEAELDKATATDYIYGIVTFGGPDDKSIAPVLTKGNIIANIDPATFTGATVPGKVINCGKVGEKCCRVLLVQKLDATKADGTIESTKAFEVSLL